LVAEHRSIHVAFLPVENPERLAVVHEVAHTEITVVPHEWRTQDKVEILFDRRSPINVQYSLHRSIQERCC
jgi:hypothetical protein